MSEAAMPIVLRRYRIERLLGEGGMGQVFLAYAAGQTNPVVIKVMHERFKTNPRFHELFEREMALLREFEHPHVVSLLDSGVDPHYGPCIIMEYLQGLPLSDVLDQMQRLPPMRVGRLLIQLCAGLQAAHDRSIIHRDLKPGNTMVLMPGNLREFVKVLDFGLAKLTAAPHLSLEELTTRRRKLVAVGTPEYLCPEAIRGNEVDHRGDYYSVGVMAYEMLVGRRPFAADSDHELLDLHLHATPPPFAEFGVTDVPPAVEAVVMSLLLKYPGDRPRSAKEIAERFQDALGAKIIPPDLFTNSGKPPTRPPSSAINVKLPSHPKAVTFMLQAWMPEKIAVIKLRGFLDEVNGQVIESVPGLVRVALPVQVQPIPPRPAPLLIWLRLAEEPKIPPPEVVSMDLYMEKPDPNQNLLRMVITLQPPEEGMLAFSPLWQKLVDKMRDGLCSHLIAEPVREGQT
jgi:serine/threonine-protein kinase